MDSKKGDDWKEELGCLDILKSVLSDRLPVWNKSVEVKDEELLDPANIRLFNIIGDGGQAYVYRAAWKNKEMAIKIFKDENEGKFTFNRENYSKRKKICF